MANNRRKEVKSCGLFWEICKIRLWHWGQHDDYKCSFNLEIFQNVLVLSALCIAIIRFGHNCPPSAWWKTFQKRLRFWPCPINLWMDSTILCWTCILVYIVVRQEWGIKAERTSCQRSLLPAIRKYPLFPIYCSSSLDCSQFSVFSWSEDCPQFKSAF